MLMMQPFTKSAADKAHDVLRTESQPLKTFFAPKTVAAIGATDRIGSTGRTLLWNLISNPFGGTVFPVNPKRRNDIVLDAAFRRCGVLRVNSISDLFDMAEVLAKQPRPKGPRLTILTNAGGPGVLATDALMASGGELAELSEEAITSFEKLLPPHWSHSNPIDILGDADPQRYTKALEIAAQDPGSDGLLAILTPQAMTDPTQQSVYFRYFHLIKLSQRIAHELLTRMCFIDYDREMALVADTKHPETAAQEILAIAWLSKLHGTKEAEFALMVSDRVQDRGLGTEMLRRLLQIGQDEQLECISAEILAENYAMQRVCKKLGFPLQRAADVVKATIELPVKEE
jgi:acyl-CoA synthetase (NDP forming)